MFPLPFWHGLLSDSGAPPDTTLFLDTFDGDGPMANRTPNIGNAWDVFSSGNTLGGQYIGPGNFAFTTLDTPPTHLICTNVIVLDESVASTGIASCLQYSSPTFCIYCFASVNAVNPGVDDGDFVLIARNGGTFYINETIQYSVSVDSVYTMTLEVDGLNVTASLSNGATDFVLTGTSDISLTANNGIAIYGDGDQKSNRFEITTPVV